MAKSKTTKRTRTLLITVLGILIIATLWLRSIGGDEAKRYLIKKVDEVSNSRYVLDVDEIDFSLWKGNLHIGHTTLRRDSAVTEYADKALLDEFDIDIEFSSLDISSIHILTFFLSKEIDIGALDLREPKVKIVMNPDYDATLVPTTTESLADSSDLPSGIADTTAVEQLNQATKEFFPPIAVEDVKILNGSFIFFDGVVKHPIRQAEGVSLEVEGLYYEDGTHTYSTENLDFAVVHATTLLGQNLAKLSVEGMKVTLDTFYIDHLHYHNIVTPQTINRVKGFRSTWLDIHVSHIDLPRLDLRSMVDDKAIIVPLVSIDDLTLDFDKDKHEMKINPAFKALPQQLIREIPLTIAIDSFLVKNAFLDIEMLAPKATKSGRLTVDTARLLITNFTNQPSRIAKNNNLRLRLDAKVNKEAPAFAEFNFDLSDPGYAYTCQLYAGPMDAALLNDFIGSQFFIEFTSGDIRRIDMRYNGNNLANGGEMDFEYSNLRLSKLHDPTEYTDEKVKRGFLASVGNMLIPKNHTSDMKKYKTSLIFYEREYNRDFIHGMVMSLLSGISSTLGFGNQNQEKVQEKLDALNESNLQQSGVKAQNKADQVDRHKEAVEKQTESQLKKQERKEERLQKKNEKKKKKKKDNN